MQLKPTLFALELTKKSRNSSVPYVLNTVFNWLANEFGKKQQTTIVMVCPTWPTLVFDSMLLLLLLMWVSSEPAGPREALPSPTRATSSRTRATSPAGAPSGSGPSRPRMAAGAAEVRSVAINPPHKYIVSNNNHYFKKKVVLNPATASSKSQERQKRETTHYKGRHLI